nr:T9SS type A sorting domain-containing protein [Bacteroidota bacterium]
MGDLARLPEIEGDNPNRFLLCFGAVGIGEQPALETLQTYVSGGYLYLMIPEGKSLLQVFDMLGRLLQSSTISGEGLYSQPFNLPSGVYIVRLKRQRISAGRN